MAINKRACRPCADPGLTISPASGLLCMEQVRYIVRTAVKNIAGRRTLLLYFYDRIQASQGRYVPAYTIFQTKDDYITWEQPPDGRGKWRTSSLERMGGYDTIFKKVSAFYSPKDEAKVTNFCNVTDKTGFEALERRQYIIMGDRLKNRIITRERKTIKRMKSVPAVPKGLNDFIHREVLPAYIFYTYHKSKNPMCGYCSACRNDVLVTGAKHNIPGVCPNCKKNITFKAAGRVKALWDQSTAQTVQKINNDELLVRIFKTSISYRSGCRSPDFRVWENARFFIRRNADSIEVDSYYYSYNRGVLTRWQKGIRPVINRWYIAFESDVCGYLYHRNLEEVLLGTPWEYCQIKPFYLKDRDPLEVIPYLRSYLRYPMIEYLVKLGLTRIAEYVIYKQHDNDTLNFNGKNVREILGILPRDIPLLQEVNADTGQLVLLRKLWEMKVSVDAELLRWCGSFDVHQHDNILFILQFTTPLKLMRYIDRQYENLKKEKSSYGYFRHENTGRVLSEYRDYISLAVKLEYNMKSSFVLFPRNMKNAHDLASGLYQKHKSEINDRLIKNAYPTLLKQYGFTKNGFTVLPPKTAQEIVAEGHALHHCVGVYVSRVVERESIILFLRRADDPTASFVTLELKNGVLIQARAQNNGNAPPDVQNYLELFKKNVLQSANARKAA